MANINDLLQIMAQLRDPEHGCPWDKEQTFETIAPYTLEEAYEVAEAIERGHIDELRDELGDLLFQVVFYAQMAKEQQRFDFNDIVAAICEKMLRRHPHVFGNAQIKTADAQTENWEHIKREERAKKNQRASQLDGVSTHLPALTRSKKLQNRAAQVGFDWPDVSGVLEKLAEETAETKAAIESKNAEHIEEEIGDLLFVVVNIARHLNVDPETALRKANRKFENRFHVMERIVGERSSSLAQQSLNELDALWNEAKMRIKAGNAD